MTYYEWINYIEEFKEKQITDDFIKKINTFDFDYPQDVMFRLEDHILKIIFDKLGLLRDDLEIKIETIKSPQELTLLINKIKDTIKEVTKLQKIKYFDNALVNEIKVDIEKYVEEYTKIIKRHFNGITSNEYLVVLNNMHLMEGV